MVNPEPDGDVTPTTLALIDGDGPPAEPPEEVAPTGELESHRGRALAAVPELPDGAVLSYVSAACLLGLPVWDVPLLNGPVHATRSEPGTTINRVKLVVRSGRLATDEIAEVESVPVTSLARTLIDLGRWAGRSTAVVCADAALRDGLVTRIDLEAALDRVFGTSGAHEARTAIGFADGRSPGIAASRARVAARWPAPVAPPRSSDRTYGPYGSGGRYEPYGPEGRHGYDRRYGYDSRYGSPDGPDRPDGYDAGPYDSDRRWPADSRNDLDEAPIPPEEWPDPPAAVPADWSGSGL